MVAADEIRIARTRGMGARGPLPRKRLKIEDWVRRKIVCGEFGPGSGLPDRDWFMREFSANRHSVQNAFESLKRDGFVEAVRGRGTRVVPRLPFDGRYLLVVRSSPEDVGTRFFAHALKTAAGEVARRRNVSFDVTDVADAPAGSTAYEEILFRVRNHVYAGVFTQTVTKDHGFDTITNINDVPIVFPNARSDRAMGSAAASIRGWATEEIYRLHFAECRAMGCRRIAVISPIPVGDVALRRERIASIAANEGLEIVRGGYQVFSMRVWNDYQYRCFLELFFMSDAGREAEAVVLADDNFLVPFVETCRTLFGRDAAKRYRLFSHGNRPNLPQTDFPVVFHGFDWIATLDTFVDYSEDVRAHVPEPRRPVAVLF